MKKVIFAIAVICGLSFSFVSCQQDNVDAVDNTAAVASSSDLSDFTALAVADTVKGKGGKGHGKGQGKGHGKGDSTKIQLTEIDITTLPATITSYISTNYAGSTIKKAAQNSDKTAYYVGILKSDSTKACLEFTAAGAFVNERTGKQHLHGTKIEVSALSQTIKDYIASKYAGATTLRAMQLSTGFLVDLKKADGTYIGVLFNTDGTFNKEVTIKPKRG
jgi:hypothetical protein